VMQGRGQQEPLEDQETPEGRGLSLEQKTWVALVLFAVVAVVAWHTMEPGKFRWLVMVVLGGLVLRLLLSTSVVAGVAGRRKPGARSK
jgi:Flp pilus assembly protein TadB